MQVSTLLAGFSFTALIEMVKEGKGLDLAQHVAVGLLIAAVGFFVSSLYLYDRLAMPPGFWLFGQRRRSKHRKTRSAESEETLKEQGPLYTHMVWTWKWIFTPGLWLALAGFFAVLWRNHSRYAIGLALVGLLIPIYLYWHSQPPVGAD